MTAQHRQRHEPRVAFVLDFLNSGGAERAALNMAAAAPRSDCFVVAERRGGDLGDDPLAAPVTFASQGHDQAGRAARMIRLGRVLRAERADVVVSMLSPLVTATPSRLLGLPVIHWLQAPWSRTTAAAAGTFTGKLHRAVLRGATADGAIVAAATPGLMSECASLGIPDSRIALLPNGIVMPPVNLQRGSNDDRMRTIVTVGRLEPQKRHDLTIRAVARIAKDTPVRLIVLGSGRDELALKQLAASLDATAFIDFAGFVAAPHSFIERADVFVLATDHEGFGNVIVEALASGVPVVVSDVPYGPRFILEDGRYGELVPPGSVTALEQALRRALSRSPLDADAAIAARARAESFDISRVAIRFEELVDLITHGGGPVSDHHRSWA